VFSILVLASLYFSRGFDDLVHFPLVSQELGFVKPGNPVQDTQDLVGVGLLVVLHIGDLAVRSRQFHLCRVRFLPCCVRVLPCGLRFLPCGMRFVPCGLCLLSGLSDVP